MTLWFQHWHLFYYITSFSKDIELIDNLPQANIFQQLKDFSTKKFFPQGKIFPRSRKFPTSKRFFLDQGSFPQAKDFSLIKEVFHNKVFSHKQRFYIYAILKILGKNILTLYFLEVAKRHMYLHKQAFNCRFVYVLTTFCFYEALKG